jgi:hypothetical protein
MRILAAASLTCLVGVATAALALRTYAVRHFLPQQRMKEAVAAGDGCILTLGDSRMDAAFDAEAFHRGLRAVGPDRCHAALAIGATDAAGHFVTAREYLALGRRPVVAVLGVVGDSLLGPERPTRPEEMVGNQVIQLAWTAPPDVLEEVPGFPFRDIGAFDAGFRFLADQATPIGRYQSLVGAKVQGLLRRLTGRREEERNRFGALDDMALLEAGLRSRAPERLAEAMRGPASERLGRWFPRTAALIEARDALVVVVELPMRSLYSRGVSDLPQTIAYHAWLAAKLSSDGRRSIDLSREPWVEDGLFADALHIGPKGASLVSEELGRQIGAMLAANGQVAQPRARP